MQEAAILAHVHDAMLVDEVPGRKHIVALRGFCPTLPEVTEQDATRTGRLTEGVTRCRSSSNTAVEGTSCVDFEHYGETK